MADRKRKIKLTEIRPISEEWDELELYKFADIIKDVYIPSDNDNLPYIGLEHINQQTLTLNSIGKSSDIKSAKFKFKAGDILFGKLRPYFRKVYSPNFSGICSTDIWVIRAKDGFDQGWLFWLLASQDFIDSASQGSSGTRMPRADWNHLKNTAWPVPTPQKQQQIAEILSSLDNKIELNRRINANLEAMASALFKKWFVDIGDGLPEGWKIKPLQEVFDFLEGPGIRNWQYAKSGTRFINIRLINGGDIDVASANFINQKDVDTKYKHFLLKSRDMVLSTSGTLGKSAIVRKAHLPLLLNTSVIRFRPKDKNNYPFMYQFLQSQSFLEEQTSMASGSVQANFGPTHLKKMFILMPGDKILKLYNDTCSALYEEITSNLDQNDKLQNLRDSLLPRLMNGRIKV